VLGLRDVIAHGAAQDAILVLLARNLRVDPEQRELFEALQAHFVESEAFRRWLDEPFTASGFPETSARES